MLRRDVLKALAALAAVPTAAFASEPGLQVGDATPFSHDALIARARAMAGQAYEPRANVPQPWIDLTYDQYRAIWFDSRNALFEGTDAPLRVDVFPPGLYFPQPVKLSVIENGAARPVLFDMAVFDTTDQFPDLPVDGNMGFSGLRLRAELNEPGIFQEYAVFQGASYFRGIGTGQIYGLSARGIALNTGEPEGEEFPDFTEYWIERPAPEMGDTVMYALLEGPSCTGVYRFDIRHGSVLEMDVQAHIFARTNLTHVGIAPLTSMFLFDETMRDRFSDFRPAVHDSDGMLIRNGAGETIWRPLTNPRSLQISAFSDINPQGFGLLQRERRFGDFADLEALYHRRPGLWITPKGDWGRGAVTLVEIPADLEIYDNVVAYWRPSDPIPQGGEAQFAYRMDWGVEPDLPDAPLRVLNTRMGARPPFGPDAKLGFIIAIDFEDGARVPDDLDNIEKLIRTSAGTVSEGVLQTNPETGGPRLAFAFEPEEAQLAEFRVQLRHDGTPLSEVWLYRWTP
ncbi:Glucans biosynthesis protein G (plasmid) [Pseudoseohaeicola sp. NH-UV-7]|uniref:glucan biosynthesis protein n=1 Tax=unclassified Sulfitobacter TaxID=196795 RepID=UPI000E0BD9AA|nr:glucan biosynthesis protein G [Sulfitobacter sp. JL08]AXI55831.1 glucan biosynthesis protein G [Sulfitobacter sp. JL08]